MMRSLLTIGLFLTLGNVHAQSLIPFKFTSDDDNRMVKENDSVKIYKATDDTSHLVSIDEETSYYRLLTRNRKVIAEGAFVADGDNNLQEGKWSQYFDNGKVMLTGYYKKSKPIGTWEEYYPSGKLKTLSNYGAVLDKDGTSTCLSGSYQEFYSNGRLKVNGFYAAERKKVSDTVEVEDPVSGTKIHKVVSQSAYRPVKTGTWEYYTEEGEFEKKTDF
jgi:antitoxin component YwqK of YwqJK toxin-antitoxin module